LEKKCRTWARKHGSVHIVTGPIVGDNRYGTIGDNNVVVPDAFFKAVLANDGKRWHTIAFVMQNRSYNENMQKCAMSVDELEELTGFDFFAALDDNQEAEAEKSYKLNFWKL
jgi:endonuclease G